MAQTLQHDPEKLMRAAGDFFSALEPSLLPPVLQKEGGWIFLDGVWFLALFYVPFDSSSIIRKFRRKKWHPFPGLFAPSESTPALINNEGIQPASAVVPS